MKAIPRDLEKLAQIERINGTIIVRKNTALPDMSFLENLEEITNSNKRKPSLTVAYNENFVLKGLRGLKKIHGDVLVITQTDSDVPAPVKERLIRLTTGKVEFRSLHQTTTKRTTTPHRAQDTTGNGTAPKHEGGPIGKRSQESKKSTSPVMIIGNRMFSSIPQRAVVP
ncbi:hypothetical protein COOONC_05380 [Cooperia oncophora]